MSMTLEEVIEHADYIVNNRKDAISVRWSMRECEQLAAWLRELQERRKAPEIIRCKECKLNKTHLCSMSFQQECEWNEDDDYCSWAERRTE